MRHRRKRLKFSRNRAQRKALVKSLTRSFITYERIKTTEAKAKALRGWADKLITWAKANTLHHKRLAFKALGDHDLVKKLFDDIGPRFKDINGGYTRMFFLGCRKGDASRMSLIELTKINKKEKIAKIKKEEAVEKTEHVHKAKSVPHKETPRKGIIDGVKGIFKKERDAL